jgi:UDP-glucose 4-epimerase
MKIGVTGGSGFIGSHVVDKLIEDGHEVVVLDIEPPKNAKVEFRRTDILNPDDCLNQTKGIDALYHLAAVADVNVAIKNKVLCSQLNIQGTANLLHASEVNQLNRFLYASTEWVYNALEEKGKIIEVNEDSPIDSNQMEHIYTVTKYAGELLCKTFCSNSNLDFTILRFGIPYGPRGRSGTVFTNFSKNALEGKPLEIHGEGTQFRNFIYIEDLAKGCVASLHPNGINQTFNLTGDHMVQIRDVAENIKLLFDGDVQVKYVPSRTQDFGGVIAENKKAKKVLGWAPSTSLKEGIVKQLDSLKEEHNKSQLVGVK